MLVIDFFSRKKIDEKLFARPKIPDNSYLGTEGAKPYFRRILDVLGVGVLPVPRDVCLDHDIIGSFTLGAASEYSKWVNSGLFSPKVGR